MRLDLLSPLTDLTGPFTTVSLDATRRDRANEDDMEARWTAQRQRLTELGAPEADLDVLADVVLAPTGKAGERTVVAVAANGEVALTLTLPGRPPRDEATFGPIPHLMPVARSLSRQLPYVLARVDRAGADIEVVGVTDEVTEEEDVTAGHDLLHKVPGGGWAHRRFQHAVEDSWQHNAGAVADRLDQIVRKDRPALVIIEGDTKVVPMLRDRLAPAVAELTVVVDGGGRAEGVDEEAEHEHVRAAIDEHRAQLRAELLDQLAQGLNKQQEAVEGLESVVATLLRGQVEELLLHDDPTSTLSLWTDGQPLHLGITKEAAVEAGATDPVKVRADAALVWALVGSSAGITLLEEGERDLRDGIAATLRWSDEATPHDAVPSMPGHGGSTG